VLGGSARPADRRSALPLLGDPDPRVRWHTAAALVAACDRRGLPALVGLLDRGPYELAARAEALLIQSAGAAAPAVALAEDDAARRKCRAAWDGWWRDHGARVSLARIDAARRVLGLRLVVVNGGHGGAGAV